MLTLEHFFDNESKDQALVQSMKISNYWSRYFNNSRSRE